MRLRVPGLHYAMADGTVVVELRDADDVAVHRYVFPAEWMERWGEAITRDLMRRQRQVTSGDVYPIDVARASDPAPRDPIPSPARARPA